MASVPYLQSDTWGQDNLTVQPPGGSCPPGQVDTGAVCIVGPCPVICRAGEEYTLSGQPPSELPSTTQEAGPRTLIDTYRPLIYVGLAAAIAYALFGR